MKIISEAIVKSNSGKTFEVKKGQIIRVIGESTADYVVFNLRNVKERFDQARTKVDQGKIFVTTGDVLISKFNNVMQTIVKDTYRGTHDMEKGMCSTSFYKKWGDEIFKIYGGVWKRLGRKKVVAPKHGCWENLAKALKPHGVPMEDVIVQHSDTLGTPFGYGSYGSRTSSVGMTAAIKAAAKIKDKARRFAAHMLEASPEDIEIDGANYRVNDQLKLFGTQAADSWRMGTTNTNEGRRGTLERIS